jgi:hypothetical protein
MFHAMTVGSIGIDERIAALLASREDDQTVETFAARYFRSASLPGQVVEA